MAENHPAEDRYDDRWHLAGSLSVGLGRSWLVTNHGLDDRWGQGPWCQAASTFANGMRWLRLQLDEEAGTRVPVRLHEQRHDLTFVYVDRKHIREDGVDAAAAARGMDGL